jgi:hypothetical protein
MSVGSLKLPIGVREKPPLPSPTCGSAPAPGAASSMASVLAAAAQPILTLRLALNAIPWSAGS